MLIKKARRIDNAKKYWLLHPSFEHPWKVKLFKKRMRNYTNFYAKISKQNSISFHSNSIAKYFFSTRAKLMFLFDTDFNLPMHVLFNTAFIKYIAYFHIFYILLETMRTVYHDEDWKNLKFSRHMFNLMFLQKKFLHFSLRFLWLNIL